VGGKGRHTPPRQLERCEKPDAYAQKNQSSTLGKYQILAVLRRLDDSEERDHQVCLRIPARSGHGEVDHQLGCLPLHVRSGRVRDPHHKCSVAQDGRDDGLCPRLAGLDCPRPVSFPLSCPRVQRCAALLHQPATKLLDPRRPRAPSIHL